MDPNTLQLVRICAALSQAAYDPSGCGREALECSIKFGLSAPVWFKIDDTEVFVAHDALRVFVAFRGTSSKRDIRTDLKALREKAPLAGTCHRGFLAAFEAVRAPLMELLQELAGPGRFVIYTGHSLGGALATLAAAAHIDGRLNGEYPPELVTFGSPRVGCGAFARALDARLFKTNLRLVNNNDAPARVPWRWFALVTVWLWPALYTHVGRLLYLTRAGELLERPPAWRVEVDRALGRLEALLWALLDGARDHGIHNYVEALEAAEE